MPSTQKLTYSFYCILFPQHPSFQDPWFSNYENATLRKYGLNTSFLITYT